MAKGDDGSKEEEDDDGEEVNPLAKTKPSKAQERKARAAKARA